MCRTACRTCRCSCRDKFAGKTERGPVRRRDRGDRLERRADSGRAEAARRGRQHAGDVHLRQRPVAVVWQSRRLGGAAARREGNDLGRRPPRAVRRALAGQDSGRHRPARNWPATIDVLPTLGQAGRRGAACGPDHRRPRHLAAAFRPAGSEIAARVVLLLLGQRPGSDPQRSTGSCTCRTPTARSPARRDTMASPGRTSRRRRRWLCTTWRRTSAKRRTWLASTRTWSSGCSTFAEQARVDLGDSLTKREGKNRRPAGQLK